MFVLGKDDRLATDYAKLSENLRRFYDFTDKVVLYVGAAGRQLLDPATRIRKLIAIDKDIVALQELKASIEARGWSPTLFQKKGKGGAPAVEVVGADFNEVVSRADVVYFEFCLHEMDDAEKALVHAGSLAADIVVYDHSAGSEWIYYGVEEDKVAHSSAVMERFGIRRRQTFQAEQRFANFEELLAKVGPQGLLAVERAQRFTGQEDIMIPMKYELDLL